MNIFDIYEIRKIIFSFLQPSKLLKGMKILIIESKFHPFLVNKLKTIHDIKIINRESYVSILKESKEKKSYWYKTISYLNCSRGDKFKVIKI